MKTGLFDPQSTFIKVSDFFDHSEENPIVMAKKIDRIIFQFNTSLLSERNIMLTWIGKSKPPVWSFRDSPITSDEVFEGFLTDDEREAFIFHMNLFS